MNKLNTTIIIRHRRENLKKCSLRGLETRRDIDFFKFPDVNLSSHLPHLNDHILLTMDAPPLTKDDCGKHLILIDATWNLAEKMEKNLGFTKHPLRRSLPSMYRTAYPRKQTGCSSPQTGLASIEALAIAFFLLGMETKGLLDHYFWKSLFFERNWPHLDLSLF